MRTGLFQSGYLPLAALDSAPHAQRTGASLAVNVDHGGDAAQMVVMRAGDPTNPDDPVRKRLENEAARFGRAHDAQVLVGGPATLLQDFQTTAGGRLWLRKRVGFAHSARSVRPLAACAAPSTTSRSGRANRAVSAASS